MSSDRGCRGSAAAAMALLALLAAACAGPPPAREEPPAGDGLPDPEEAGLDALARVSRYVFGEMNRRQGECGSAPVMGERLDYAIEVQVAGGRIEDARLRSVSARLGGFPAPLLQERWPPELVAMVDCLRPHLRALRPPRALPDGTFLSRFSVGAAPEPAPEPAAAEGDMDPAEPGLPGLVRTARYVFREMLRQSDVCSLTHSGPAVLSYTLEVEVKGGRVARATLVEAHWQDGASPPPLAREAWPPELVRYAACLQPHLLAMALEPPPEDGVYRPDYLVRPTP